jgi:hypothetical protein
VNKVDFSGRRYGRLTVISFSHIEKNKSFSNAMCDCGTEIVANNNRMKNGYTRSCGCLRFKPGAAQRELYGKYVKRAKVRGFLLEFDLATFIAFVQQNCFYCDVSPSQVIESFKGREKFRYNGIDRWNNDLGYTKDNTVPCCGDCNRQKLEQSGEDFIFRCQIIASRANNILSKRNLFTRRNQT